MDPGSGRDASTRDVAAAQSSDPEAAVEGPSSTSGAAPAAVFARRKNRGGNIRKREVDVEAGVGGGAGEEDSSAVVRKAKTLRTGDALAFSTKGSANDERVSNVTFESNRAIQQGNDNRVTAALETETELDRDARALREKILSQGDAGTSGNDDGTYKGMTGYKDYRAGFRREHTVGAEKGTGAHGPLRASMYVRVSARFDYQPDICKDYKETGFCSYGDSCKFMHDRGDYKSGWELERDYAEEQKAKLEEKLKGWNPDEDGDAEAAESDEDDGLPFACLTCRKPWEELKSPVVTRCRHYFCEACALRTNAKGGKCDACGKPTMGIFNVANDIMRKMKKKAAKQGA